MVANKAVRHVEYRAAEAEEVGILRSFLNNDLAPPPVRRLFIVAPRRTRQGRRTAHSYFLPVSRFSRKRSQNGNRRKGVGETWARLPPPSLCKGRFAGPSPIPA